MQAIRLTTEIDPERVMLCNRTELAFGLAAAFASAASAGARRFARFGLTPVPAKMVKAPLIKECLANIECRVVDIVRKHDIVVLEAVAAHLAPARKEKRTVHAVGDGTFIVDGSRLKRRKQMASKLPAGV